MQLFKGRMLTIATKHKKEQVIAPLIENYLDVQCLVAPDFDSDQFGTFTGEVERIHSPNHRYNGFFIYLQSPEVMFYLEC